MRHAVLRHDFPLFSQPGSVFLRRSHVVETSRRHSFRAVMWIDVYSISTREIVMQRVRGDTIGETDDRREPVGRQANESIRSYRIGRETSLL